MGIPLYDRPVKRRSFTDPIARRQLSKIKEVLKRNGPMTVHTMAAHLFRTDRSIRDYAHHLHTVEGSVYIHHWVDNDAKKGRMVPAYALKVDGKEKDAPKVSRKES